MNEVLRRLLFLPDQASTFAKDVDQLHYFVILTTIIMSTRRDFIRTSDLWRI